MKKIVIGSLLLAVVVAQLFIMGADYWININENYALYNDADPLRTTTLGYGPGGKQDLVPQVTEYLALDSYSVIGKNDRMYFWADQDGRVQFFDNEEGLFRVMQHSAASSMKFRSVSRFDDPAIWTTQLVIVAVLLSVVSIILIRKMRVR